MTVGGYRRHRWVSLPFHALALAVMFLSVLYVTYDPQSSTSFAHLTRAFIPSCLALSFIYAGYRVTTEELSLEAASQMLIIILAFGGIGLLLSGLILSLQLLQQQSAHEPLYRLLFTGTAAAALATPLSYYYTVLQVSFGELEAQNRQITKLNKRLSIAQRVLRHNLRNELTAVSGYTELLEDGLTAPKHEEWLEQLQESQENLQAMAAKAEMTQSVWECEQTEFELSNVVEREIEAIRNRFDDVTFRTSFAENDTVYANEQLKLAVREALMNAVEHNDHDDLTVWAETEPVDEKRCLLRISDTGSGIPPIELDSLREEKETQLIHSDGLGLHLIYWVVDRSNGTFEIRENEPHGTVVKLEFPSNSQCEETTASDFLVTASAS